MSWNILTAVEERIFGHRKLVLSVFTVITLFMSYPASQLRVDAGFEKHLPLKHPYIQTFLQYRQEFGGANRLLVAVRSKHGDIFTAQFFTTLKAVTEEVFFLPGVNRSTVSSIFTPNVRFIEVVEGGFSGGNVVPHDFRPTPDRIDQVRENILKAGIVGRLVASDFTAAIVSAELVEFDPRTGGELDYLRIASLLEERIRDKYSSENIDIHIAGFAKVVGDIADGAGGVIVFFGIAFLITAALVYFFTHSFWLTILPMSLSSIAVIWTLGLLTVLGFGLDPMSILVPFLIFAIGTSHGVQMINGIGAEIYEGADVFTASRRAFRRLLIPGSVALATDAAGFLTMLLLDIRIIRDLAVTASLGVMVIILTNLLLLPILASYLRLGERTRKRIIRGTTSKAGLWQVMARAVDPKVASVSIAAALVLLTVGTFEARNVKIGDSHEGVPELRPDSRYNKDIELIADKFSIGVDMFTVIAETVPDGCVRYDVMDGIDRFQWHIANVQGVQATRSMPQVAKIIYAGWNEGHLKWRVLPRDSQTMKLATSPIQPSTGLLNQDCSAIPVYIFLEDHKGETIARVVDAVKVYGTQHSSQDYRFRLAAGNAGIMGATNEVVGEAQVLMLLWIYVAVVTLCLLSFRSWRDTFCIVAPLGLVSVLAYAVMSLLDIGLKVSTLPVVALGVGIGVDYGIYTFHRLRTHLDEGLPLREAYLLTLRITGNAVLVTGLTLAVGVSTWIFSALRFQADMGLLLTFMFLANMLAALLLLPALASFVRAGSVSNPRNGLQV